MPEQPATTRTAAATGPMPRIAVTATFAVHALLFASWTAHVPSIKSDLGLSDAALGTALLGAPIGSVLATVVVGWALPRLGSAPVVRIALVGYATSGVTVGLADSGFALFGTLALWGAFQGSLDVAMNTQGVTVERTIGRPIMSGLHGAWSIGGFAGAGLGTVGVTVGMPLATQLALEGVLALAVVGAMTLTMLPDRITPRERNERGDRRGVLTPAVVVLGVVAFACMTGEGAAADWSAVYLRETLDTSATYAGLGYAVFSLAMLTVRLAGNRLLLRTPPRTLLPVLAGIATLGMLAALLSGSSLVALVGFGTLGLGLALVVPTAFSSAGRLGGDSAGSSIAAVAAIGWAGFMCGPPIIGHLADALSLSGALLLLPVLTAGIAIAVRLSKAFEGGVDAR